MKCYHHNDADGRCAAAIVYQKYLEVELIEVGYKDKIDIEAIKKDEWIWIVDFSFKPEVMKEVLKKTKHIVWIDHHKTAMEYDYGIELNGIRKNEYSGCELTWQYVCKDIEFPETVKLIGDYDNWIFKFGDRSRHFYLGLRLFDCNPKSWFWVQLFRNENNLVEEVISKGRTCMLFQDNICEDHRKSFGFETKFEGYNCYALGLYMFGSRAFGKLFNEYDVCISFVFDGVQWNVGLYSNKVDVGNLAKKHDGGGHIGAAGFVCDKLPFSINKEE